MASDPENPPQSCPHIPSPQRAPQKQLRTPTAALTASLVGRHTAAVVDVREQVQGGRALHEAASRGRQRPLSLSSPAQHTQCMAGSAPAQAIFLLHAGLPGG
jgi:hypothetical protein